MGDGVGVGLGEGVGVGVGVTPVIVSVSVGDVAAPVPWQSAPRWALTVNDELPGDTASVVVTDRDVETATLVIVSGFVPKTAVAPEGSPLALSVSVHGLLFPFWEIDTVPKTAVSPGATDTLVGDATVTVPGCAAMTVPPASIATRRPDATIATSRRLTSGEPLRNWRVLRRASRGKPVIGNGPRWVTVIAWDCPATMIPRAEGTIARHWCAKGPPDVATPDERRGYRPRERWRWDPLGPDDAAETDVAGRGVHGFALPGGRAVAQAVAGRAQV